MPKIKIDHVVSFSSEDPVCVAANILESDPNKKWKCNAPGEKSASVTVQLEKATVISGVDIGNEHSAFVEVLVKRSSSDDKSFKVLVGMSSFMSPMEARQSENPNRVRMFSGDKLTEKVRDEKWDTVKFFCTQPYNKHVQYGLTFVTLHAPQDSNNTLGKFVIRSPSPDDIGVGSIFARRNELSDTALTLKGTAAIRDAGKPETIAEKGLPKCKPASVSVKPSSSVSDDNISTANIKNRNDLLYDMDDETGTSKIDDVMKKHASETKAKIEITEKTKKDTPKRSHTTEKKTDKNPQYKEKRKTSNESGNTNKKTKKDSHVKRPFHSLFSDVTLVISGIQNPERGNLRDKVLQMGAKYKADWDNTCTHLVCAFMNTPKYHQVRGRGKIVTKKWIDDCYLQRKKLPWRRYALDRNEQKKAESEDEIWEDTGNNTGQELEESYTENLSGNDTEDEIDRIRLKNKQEASTSSTFVRKSSTDSEKTLDLDETWNEQEKATSSTTVRKVSTDSDDMLYIDETKKKEEATSSTPARKLSTESDKTLDLDEIQNFANVDTDEEILIKDSKEIEENIPDIFKGKTFTIDEEMEEDDKEVLERFIKAFDGVVAETINDKVNYMLSYSSDSVSELKTIFPDVQFVSPLWVLECRETQQFVPVNQYLLVK